MRSNRITTPFGAESTAAEVITGIDLGGECAVVTGGAAGLGLETARALASANAEVTLAVRNVEAGHRVADDLIADTGNKHVLVASLDLADQASVAAFVAEWNGPLHILVNNAGIMATPELRTPQGWELQFATNNLGHFALATGLHGALAAAGGARVVSVSSVGHETEKSISTTSTSSGARTTRGRPTASPRRPTASPRRPTCCSRSRPPNAGCPRESRRTP